MQQTNHVYGKSAAHEEAHHSNQTAIRQSRFRHLTKGCFASASRLLTGQLCLMCKEKPPDHRHREARWQIYRLRLPHDRQNCRYHRHSTVQEPRHARLPPLQGQNAGRRRQAWHLSHQQNRKLRLAYRPCSAAGKLPLIEHRQHKAPALRQIFQSALPTGHQHQARSTE